jgi:AraC family mar-sox-rob regulon transcriptional activator
MLGTQDLSGLPRKNWMIAQAMLGNAEWQMAGMRIFLQKYFYFLETKAHGGNAKHTHDWFEFSQLVCGKMEYSDSQRTAVFNPGDVFFMSAGSEHSWRAITAPLVISSFQLKLSPLEQSGARVIAALRATSDRHEFRLSETGRLRPIARQWWIDLSDPIQRPLIRERLLAHFQIFFAAFLESVVGDSLKEIRDPGVMPPPATRLAKTRQMTAFIRQNLNTSIQVKDIASHFDYSVRHIQRMFLADFGVTVGNYISDQKLQLAQRLLAVSDDPIKSIAVQVGFGDSGRFCRAFRRHLAMSPSQYRESVRSDA